MGPLFHPFFTTFVLKVLVLVLRGVSVRLNYISDQYAVRRNIDISVKSA